MAQRRSAARPGRRALEPAPRAGEDLAARRAHVVGERARDRGEVDDRGRRRVQRGDPGGMRLDLAQPGGVEAPQARDAVGGAAPLELVERRQLAASSATISLPQRS